MWRISRCLAVAGLVAAGWLPGLVGAPAATAASPYSQADPPPVCSEPHTGACIAQPDADTAGNSQTPTLISMPTLESLPAVHPSDPAWQATFVITGFAKPLDGYSNRPAEWTNFPLQLIPITGYSDPAATAFSIYQAGDCTGHLACTYQAGAGDYKPGWYYASDQNATLTYQKSCPPSPNGVYGCIATTSASAVYVPDARALEPPRVAVATKGQGLTTKAVASVRDPYGKSVTLAWDFGDGSALVAGTPGHVVTHQYAAVGDYAVTALVRASDGRTNAASADAGLLPPRPTLQAVDRIGTGTTGVAVGLVQGWPSGGSATLHYWNSACPADPDSAAPYSDGTSNWAYVAADGTVSLPVGYLDPAAASFVLEVQGWEQFGNRSVELHRDSACLDLTPPAAAATTADVSAGATTLPVDPGSVAVGHVAAVDAGSASAEQRTVQAQGTGSLTLQTALDSDHAAGAYVVDAGPPVAPYVVPGPPGDPTAPVLPGGAVATVPGRAKVTGTRVSHRTSLVVAFTTPPSGGKPITSYDAVCASPNRGTTRHATGAHSPLTVPRLTAGKRYACRVRAVNAVGAGAWSLPGKTITLPARKRR